MGDETNNMKKETIEIHTFSGMTIGMEIERGGKKWKVIDNNRVVITTLELVD